MTRQFRWSAILLVVGASLLAACSLGPTKRGSENSAKTGTGNSTRTNTAFSPSNDARKDIHDALGKLRTAYPYRLTETASATANGQTAMPESTRVVEFAAADRSHMKWAGGPGGNVEEITIGEKRYWFSGGKWSEAGGPSMAQRAKRGEEFANKLAEMVKEVKYIGPETVNGVACHAYSYTLETTVSGQNYVGTGKLWIGAADGLPHQNDSEFKVATYGNKSHIVYEYNVNFKIEPPSM